MRRRLLLTTVGVALGVLLAIAWPIFVVLRDAARDEAEQRQDDIAERIVTQFQEILDEGGVPPIDELVRYVPLGDQITIQEPDGTVRLETGDAPSGALLVGTATSLGGVRLTVRSPDIVVQERVGRYVVALGTLVLVGVAAAALFSWIAARRMARPFEQLSTAASRLGEGDFSAVVPRESGVREIDDIAHALAVSASRIDQMLAAERSFAGDASHQLRTGLTGLTLRLEMLARHPDAEVRAEADSALYQTTQLNDTIDGLLALARHGRTIHRVSFDLGRLVTAHVHDARQGFARAGRALAVSGESSRVLGTPGFAGQVVDVLLDNALRHGAGAVSVLLQRDAVVVRDEGREITASAAAELFLGPSDPGAEHGRGLALARRLAEADGGSIELVSASPTEFRYRLSVDHGDNGHGGPHGESDRLTPPPPAGRIVG